MRLATALSMLVLLASAASGCGESTTTPTTDGATTDSVELDSAFVDSSAPTDDGVDSRGDASDGGDDGSIDTIADAADAAAPFDILGAASGECGGLAAAVKSTASVTLEVPLVFDATEKYERAPLARRQDRVRRAERWRQLQGVGGDDPRAPAELRGRHAAEDRDRDRYGPPPDGGAATITDLLVSIGGDKIGVNPKRVFKPLPLSMTDAEVRTQLVKDFESIKASSARVLPEDRWVKQILHVWVPSATYYDAVKRVLPTIDDATRSNTLVLITRTTGGGFLYCDPDPAPGAECPPIK
ncbi:MAG: hypothetical protein IPJ34_33795 [Myxococcales bacterium]|nr:hypothetical protein [Myxococcales bacterium]